MRIKAGGVSGQQQKGPQGSRYVGQGLGRLIVDETDDVTGTQQVWAAALPHIGSAVNIVVSIILLFMGA